MMADDRDKGAAGSALGRPRDLKVKPQVFFLISLRQYIGCFSCEFWNLTECLFPFYFVSMHQESVMETVYYSHPLRFCRYSLNVFFNLIRANLKSSSPHLFKYHSVLKNVFVSYCI